MHNNKLTCVAMPFRAPKGLDAEAYSNGVVMKATAGARPAMPCLAWSSLLPYTFNLLWTGCINTRKGVPVPQGDGTEVNVPISYFAMIHDDVIPQNGWLNVLIDELETNGADIVSAVIPIKDEKGLTSTAIDTTGDEWSPRRLTMTEVCDLPMTFGEKEAGGPLLLNTGLWVCRFDAPWVEKVGFRQQDQIFVQDNGEFAARTISEDWDFSRQVKAQGGKLMATRKVGLIHESGQWHNRGPWGTWKTDIGCEPKPAEVSDHGERSHNDKQPVLLAGAAA